MTNKTCVHEHTTDDLVEFLKKCKTALQPDGLIIVKENVLRSGSDNLDDQDASFNR